MAAHTNRFSTLTTGSADEGEKKKDMWNSMLESVASGKRLPEKNLLVLGGTVETQREFLEALSGDFRKTHDSDKLPPVANHFALGNTYYDVLDADQEDTLARISLYSLTKPSHTFSSLLRPLLTPQTIPNTLVVVLLDWSQPWLWMRQLREWILLLRTVLLSLSIEAKDAMEEVMIGWRDRGRGGAGTNLDGTGAGAGRTEGGAGASEVALPLGPGEWEDALGLPLAVVCQNADKMDGLEKLQSWKEEEFDIVLQFLRTVLLRHGASLIYTTSSTPSQLPSLIHSSLGITSLLKRQPLKHNVIDRDKIMVPPNWDSWGKIRVIRDGFDVERVSEGWSIDLDQPFPRPRRTIRNGVDGDGVPAEDGPAEEEHESTDDEDEEDEVEGSAVTLYEQTIEDPSKAPLQMAGRDTQVAIKEVETDDAQTFLAQQLKVLESHRLKAEEEAKSANESGLGTPRGRMDDGANSPVGGSFGLVGEHIGPVQFNMGGIQVDADEMVQRLKRNYGSSPEPHSDGMSHVEEEVGDQTEKLNAFFNGLMNRSQSRTSGA